MSLDILFIHPNASKKIYQELSKDHSAYEPPIWAGMLANHCRAKNFKTAILDCEVKKLDYEKDILQQHKFSFINEILENQSKLDFKKENMVKPIYISNNKILN